jgi:hypothetical protein
MTTEELQALEAAEAAAKIAEQRKRGRKLFRFGLVGMVALCGYYASIAHVEDPLHLYLGIAIIALSGLPSLLWAKRASEQLPVFEVFVLTCVTAYAIPLLGGHEQLYRYDPEVRTTAAVLVLLYLGVANLVYSSVPAKPIRSAAWRREIVTRDISKFLGYGMVLATAYTVIAQFTYWIPWEYQGIARAVAFGVGNIACFMQSRRWGLGELLPQERAVFASLLIAQIVFAGASLFLVNVISLLLLSTLGYVSAAKKLPLVPILIGLPVLAILHNGKSAMREQYWGAGGLNRNDIAIGELATFYTNWFAYGLNPPAKNDDDDEDHKSANAKLLERTSLFHILCLVVSVTPERQPFLGGDTYSQILSQFVPRYFWPDKPSAHIATNKLAVYYGLQREEDTAKTTIGFGLIAEAYANFGFMGVAMLAATFAFVFKKIAGWASASPILSYPGLMMVVLVAWSFNTEFTLSVWLSSLFQAVVVVIGVPFVTRNFFR